MNHPCKGLAIGRQRLGYARDVDPGITQSKTVAVASKGIRGPESSNLLRCISLALWVKVRFFRPLV